MRLPPLDLIDQPHFFLQGEIHVDSSAAIAPGVLLKADPGTRVIIHSGVCIGAGTVIHARQGDLILEPEVNLGAGSLVVGSGTIAAHTCIGALSTLINPSNQIPELLPSGSLVGDRSRQETIAATARTIPADSDPVSPPAPPDQPTAPEAKSGAVRSESSPSMATGGFHGQPAAATQNGRSPASASPSPDPFARPAASQAKQAESSPPASAPSPQAGLSAPMSPSAIGVQVYGQGQVNQLLNALFPHRQAQTNSRSED